VVDEWIMGSSLNGHGFITAFTILDEGVDEWKLLLFRFIVSGVAYLRRVVVVVDSI